MVDTGDAICALWTSPEGELHVGGKHEPEWEHFEFQRHEGKYFYIRSVHGKYLSCDLNEEIVSIDQASMGSLWALNPLPVRHPLSRGLDKRILLQHSAQLWLTAMGGTEEQSGSVMGIFIEPGISELSSYNVFWLEEVEEEEEEALSEAPFCITGSWETEISVLEWEVLEKTDCLWLSGGFGEAGKESEEKCPTFLGKRPHTDSSRQAEEEDKAEEDEEEKGEEDAGGGGADGSEVEDEGWRRLTKSSPIPSCREWSFRIEARVLLDDPWTLDGLWHSGLHSVAQPFRLEIDPKRRSFRARLSREDKHVRVEGCRDDFLCFTIWKNYSEQWSGGRQIVSASASGEDLDSMLGQYFKREVMDDKNRYRCSHCGSLERAEKRLGMSRTPEHLLINLKRFSYDFRTNTKSKIFTKINYPISFRLPDTKSQESRYGLYAVVVHSGQSSSAADPGSLMIPETSLGFSSSFLFFSFFFSFFVFWCSQDILLTSDITMPTLGRAPVLTCGRRNPSSAPGTSSMTNKSL